MSAKRDVRDMLSHLQTCSDARHEAIHECVKLILDFKEKFQDNGQVVAAATCEYLAKMFKRYMQGKID